MARLNGRDLPPIDWRRFDGEMRERVKGTLRVDELATSGGVRLDRVGRGRCPFHEDRSPSFQAGAFSWICYTGCGQGDAIDFIVHAEGLDHKAAVRRGAALAGIDYDGERAAFLGQGRELGRGAAVVPPPLKVASAQRRERSSPRWEQLAAELEQRGHQRPDAEQLASDALKDEARIALAFVASSAASELDDGAARWLKQERGLDPEMCAHFGIRSSRAAPWREAVEAAAALFGVETVKLAGLMRSGGEHDGAVFPRLPHFLVLTYEDERGGPDTIRLRNLTPQAEVKALGLLAPRDVPALSWEPMRPFLENQAIEAARRCSMPLYVCEGELDALSFWQMGRPALATYGASRWPSGWCAPWAGLSRVIIVADQDGERRAGEKLAERIGAAAVHELGLNETGRILRGATVNKVQGLKDANDLLRAGKLGQFIELCEAMP
jgi:hypothetical protein